MIDLILSLLDRLKDLVIIHTENRRKLFEDHLEPLFNDLTAIHTDYRSSFQAIHDMLVDGALSYQEIKEKTTELRAGLLHVRQKVRAYADALSENDKRPDEAAELMVAIALYFMCATGDEDAEDPLVTRYTTLISILSGLDGSPMYREAAVEEVSKLIVSVDNSWNWIVESYGAARVALLK